MKNINKLSKIVASTLGTVAILGAVPQAMAETSPLNATVDVLNTFALSETTGISFGTIRAKASPDGAGNVANVAMPADPGASTATGSVGTPSAAANAPALTVLTAGAPGVYEVDGAAAFTALTFDVNADTVALVLGTAPPTKPNQFTLSNMFARDAVGNEIVLDNSTSGLTLTTDVNGDINFTVGGTLSTEDKAVSGRTWTDGTYVDGTYAGSLTLTVVY